MSLVPSRAHSAQKRGDLTTLSTMDILIVVGLISAGLWALIGVTIFGT